MKKLTLQLDQLAVESFATAATPAPRGTVQAHATQIDPTCGPENTCGPYTCRELYCVKDTYDPEFCGGSAGCPPGSLGCPPATGQLSCVGCTTYDYTQQGGDTCSFCLSRESDSPERCRCI